MVLIYLTIGFLIIVPNIYVSASRINQLKTINLTLALIQKISAVKQKQ